MITLGEGFPEDTTVSSCYYQGPFSDKGGNTGTQKILLCFLRVGFLKVLLGPHLHGYIQCNSLLKYSAPNIATCEMSACEFQVPKIKFVCIFTYYTMMYMY